MFMTTKRHLEILAKTERLMGGTIDALDKSARKFRAERDDARAELATLKASRERSNANLRPGNVRRKLAAQTA